MFKSFPTKIKILKILRKNIHKSLRKFKKSSHLLNDSCDLKENMLKKNNDQQEIIEISDQDEEISENQEITLIEPEIQLKNLNERVLQVDQSSFMLVLFENEVMRNI